MVVGCAEREGSCLVGGGEPRRVVVLESGWGAVCAEGTVAASVVVVVREVWGTMFSGMDSMVVLLDEYVDEVGGGSDWVSNVCETVMFVVNRVGFLSFEAAVDVYYGLDCPNRQGRSLRMVGSRFRE